MSRTHKNVTETLDHDGPKLKSDGEAETLDHGGPKLKVDGKAGTSDHGGPKLTGDNEARTLDHGGPKLKVKEAGMGNQEKLFSKEIEDRSTDKEQLPETGGCIFFDEKGKRMNTDKTFLVIAEKPSVSLAIAQVLGKYERMNGYVQGNGFICSWCLGHLAEYAVPEAYDPRYRNWKLEDLPIIPQEWKVEVIMERMKQFRVLEGLLNRRDVDYVLNACDAGREGEMIFHRVYALSKSRIPVKRLWINSLEDKAIRDGLKDMKDDAEYKKLLNAAECRAQADWLIGMNGTRAFTGTYFKKLNIGRVMTPTLAMIVERQEAIDRFHKEPYYKVILEADGIRAVSDNFAEEEDAKSLAEKCSGSDAVVIEVNRQMRTKQPPRLYDLTSLQRDANRTFGYTAKKTLDYAQKLYEAKYITYPRTDSRFIPAGMEDSVKELASAVHDAIPGISRIPLGEGFNRLVNDEKVSDHHAILPTSAIEDREEIATIPEGPSNVLLLICMRLMESISDPFIYDDIKVELLCGDTLFHAAGRRIRQEGFKAFSGKIPSAMKYRQAVISDYLEEADPEDGNAQGFSGLLADGLREGVSIGGMQSRYEKRFTEPPRPYTEDTLLAAMENAGKADFDEETERKGLGTPATRASVIEHLISCGYVERKGRKLLATQDGMELISVMPEYIKSPDLTADWENKLLKVEKGNLEAEAFMNEIRELVSQILMDCRNVPDADRRCLKHFEEIGTCPICGNPVLIGSKSYFCSGQDCRFVIWKDLAFLRSMKKQVDDEMAAQLLANGEVKVDNLYSVKKDKYFSAKLVMEIIDDKPEYSLEFPKREKKGKKKTKQKIKSKWE